MHAWRRRAALAELARRGAPESIVVICYGNICCSPFAAAVLQTRLAATDARVASGGFIGPGRSCPANAVDAARRRHQDLASHRSQLLTPALVRTADLLVVMDAEQRDAVRDRFGRTRRDVLLLGDFDPLPIQTRAIRDPVECPPAVFEEVYARIDRCVTVLAAAIKGSVGADRPVGVGLGVVQRRPPAPTRRDSL
jgi:protein-tyrosine phosphatase